MTRHNSLRRLTTRETDEHELITGHVRSTYHDLSICNHTVKIIPLQPHLLTPYINKPHITASYLFFATHTPWHLVRPTRSGGPQGRRGAPCICRRTLHFKRDALTSPGRHHQRWLGCRSRSCQPRTTKNRIEIGARGSYFSSSTVQLSLRATVGFFRLLATCNTGERTRKQGHRVEARRDLSTVKKHLRAYQQTRGFAAGRYAPAAQL